MATYKKRGGKPTTKAEKIESIEENSTTAEVFNTLDESASKTEEWVVKNQNIIYGVVGAIAVIVLGYLGYTEFIIGPKTTEGMNEMFTAKQYFEEAETSSNKDSLYTLALNGAEGKFGFVDIADEYGSTPAGNLANYYAGMAYLKLRDYQKAIEYLSAFSSDDMMLKPIAKGGIGDAFIQLNQPEDALGYYEEAFKASKNDFTAPLYLFKAANVAYKLGDSKKALDYYKRIEEEYPDSNEATNVEVYIGRAEASVE
ncbi:tetratricopeptide repeat protein [Aegicerativicinus sediminis]|uniref:tetratricopeptide repeat protein n=1 Tax=Aegicerativicinus sediminis TaxID=2893202 RepID=UPI001E4FD9A9|nr:tetratricopeptide repeat protein [Aegicerativicinus sediminis]